MRQRIKRGISIVAVLLLVGLTACTGKQGTSTTGDEEGKQTIKIAYLPITHALPLFMVQELQTEDSNLQIELIKYGSWTELMDAVNTGRVDGASMLIELAMKAKTEGIDLKAVALGHKDGNVIIVANDIETAADLKGKSFAIPSRMSSHYILVKQMLEENNMTEEDINLCELSPTEMPSALASGQIAGYCVAEPFGAKAVNAKVGKVFSESQKLWEDSICCALVMNGSFLEENPSVAKTFVEEYQKAGDYLTQNPEEGNKVVKDYLSVDDSVLDLSMKWISYDDLTIKEDTYNNLCDYMKQYKIIDTLPTYEEFVAGEE